MEELRAALTLLRENRATQPAAGQEVTVTITWLNETAWPTLQPDLLGQLATELSLYRRFGAEPVVLGQVWEHIQLFLLEVLAGTCPELDVLATARRVINLLLEELEYRAEALNTSPALKAQLRELRVRHLFSPETQTEPLLSRELWENLRLPERKL